MEFKNKRASMEWKLPAIKTTTEEEGVLLLYYIYQWKPTITERSPYHQPRIYRCETELKEW